MLYIYLVIANVIVLLVAAWFRKETLKKWCKVLLWWLTISFLLPLKAREYGLATKRKHHFLSFLLMFLSPAALTTYYLVFVACTAEEKTTNPYNEIRFTTRTEIASITGISDFPEFEVPKMKDGKIWYKFKDKKQVDSLFAELEILSQSADSIHWSKEYRFEKADTAFYGGYELFTYRHKCYGGYDIPDSAFVSDSHVTIIIGKKGFTVMRERCHLIILGCYTDSDSLDSLTGVKFPRYNYINCRYFDMDVDYSVEGIIKFESMLPKRFIEDLRKSDKWQELKDGTFEYCVRDTTSFIDMNIDPTSRYASISYVSLSGR